MINWLSIALAGGGAAIGASGRYLVMQFSELLTRWREKHSGYQPSRFPWPTFIINVSGSFLLGLVMASNLSTLLKVTFGAGILGGFTTFSTMANEIVLLARDQRLKMALLYGVLTIVFGVIAASVGMQAG
ncbi:MAG TPA: chromosome condensation protein CrcB [Lactobacillus sp.]|nr:chromosome condensation protein CrcB [Lactobacillus sp.]